MTDDQIIHADADVLEQLADDVVSSVININNLNEELSQKLKRLSATFRDEGFGIVQGYIDRTKKTIEDAFPDLQLIARRLKERADAMRRSKNALKL